MDANPLPDADLLRQLLDYNPETGEFRWRLRTPDMFEDGRHPAKHSCKTWNAQFGGRPAFISIIKNGYRRGRINGVSYLAHRVAWKIVNGTEPRVIDHLNGDTGDNRIANLRSVTKGINNRNLAKRSANTSGFAGVGRTRSASSPWRARLGQKTIGSYATAEEAIAARLKAEQRHGYITR